MEHRAIVRFLTLEKLPARNISAELEGVSGHEAHKKMVPAVRQ
jgi:hypothetical protein